MKKIKKITLLVIILFAPLAFLVFSKNPEDEIKEILASESYSYLPEEVKELVENSFIESGELILTEKNKVENEPYLNPKYIEYLGKSSEEKAEQSTLPDVFVTDWIPNTKELSSEPQTLPTKYDLRDPNADGDNSDSLITAIKNQTTLNTCWTYATVEQAESYSIQNGLKSSEDATLSARQIDYLTSNNGYLNSTGKFQISGRGLTQGGSFMHASQGLASGVSLVSESWEENDGTPITNSFTDSLEMGKIASIENSTLELNSSANMMFNGNADELDEFIAEVKTLVKNNGGALVSTEAPGSPCASSRGDDGSIFIRVDGSCVEDSYHSMQIIGWDDDYEFNYCNTGLISNDNYHPRYSGEACAGYGTTFSTKDGTAKKGAWLVRNSWGNALAPYIYLAYDSERYDIDVMTSLNAKNEDGEYSWDNVYSEPFINHSGNSYSWIPTTSQIKTFSREIETPEKIQKIKFYTLSTNRDYTVTVNGKSYATTSSYPGYKTIDVSSANIIVDNETNEDINIQISGGSFARKSIVVLTSNVEKQNETYAPDETPMILSKDEKLLSDIASENNKYNFELEYATKNIKSGTALKMALVAADNSSTIPSYKIISTGGNEYEFSYQYNLVSVNDAKINASVKDTLTDGVYAIVTYYGEMPEIGEEIDVENFAFATNYFYIGEPKSEINYAVANDEGGSVNISKETIDPLDGRKFINGSITSNKITGSTATPADYYQLKNWTINKTMSQYEADGETPAGTIVSTGLNFVPTVVDENFYAVYSSAIYYANFEEEKATYTFNSYIIDNLSGDDALIAYVKSGDMGPYINTHFYTGKVTGKTTTDYSFTATTPYSTTASLYAGNKNNDDFEFAGWFVTDANNNYGGKTSISTSLTITPSKVSEAGKPDHYETTSYTAVWRPKVKKVTIKFESDGQIYDSKEVAIGEKVAEPKNVTKSGYILEGWYNGTAKWNFNTSTVSKDITLRAKWRQRGDVNGDGKISSSDYVKIKNHIMGTSKLSGIDLEAADYDNSGGVKSSDYVKVKNLIMR